LESSLLPLGYKHDPKHHITEVTKSMSHRKHRKLGLQSSLVALATFLTTSFFLVILTQAQQPGKTQAVIKSEDVSDKELKDLAAGLEEVETIRSDLQGTLAGVRDPAKAQQLQQQANSKMIQALDDNNIKPARYNALVQSIDSDTEFLERFKKVQAEYLEEQKGGDGDN